MTGALPMTPERYQRFLDWEAEQERVANEVKARTKLGVPKAEAEVTSVTVVSDKVYSVATERARGLTMQGLRNDGLAVNAQALALAANRSPEDALPAREPDTQSVAGRCRDCLVAEQVVRKVHERLDTRWARTDGSTSATQHAYDSQSGEPYHLRWRRELAWLRCWDVPDAPTLVYVAHPVSGDFRSNLRDARAWVKWLRRLTLDDIQMRLGYKDVTALPVFQAPWLVEPEDVDHDARKRARVIAGCVATAARYDEVWALVRWSSGVATEARAARRVRDLTNLGKTPPEWGGRK